MTCILVRAYHVHRTNKKNWILRTFVTTPNEVPGQVRVRTAWTPSPGLLFKQTSLNKPEVYLLNTHSTNDQSDNSCAGKNPKGDCLTDTADNTVPYKTAWTAFIYILKLNLPWFFFNCVARLLSAWIPPLKNKVKAAFVCLRTVSSSAERLLKLSHKNVTTGFTRARSPSTCATSKYPGTL